MTEETDLIRAKDQGVGVPLVDGIGQPALSPHFGPLGASIRTWVFNNVGFLFFVILLRQSGRTLYSV